MYCPTTELPEDYLNSRSKKKRKHIEETDQQQQNERQIFQRIFKTVKEFGLTNIQTSKKKILDDKLTKLGAPPVKQQKMPFKMKMGILEGRKKREKRQIQEARVSGQVLSTKKKKETKVSKKSSNGQPDFDVKTRGGVLRLGNPNRGSKRGRR